MRDLQQSLQANALLSLFSKFDRIHKCKRCLKFICLNCGDAKEFVIDEEGKMSLEKHRVCVNCRADIQLIKQNMDHVSPPLCSIDSSGHRTALSLSNG